MIPDHVKTMQFAKIEDVHELRRALEILLDLATKLDQRNEDQGEEIQKLKDEVARLKGGNARPVFKKKKESRDISSGGKEKGNAKKFAPREPKDVHIDRTVRVPLCKDDLPADIEFKGYSTFTQQEVIIRTDNVEYILEVYYSPSERKTYTAALPASAGKGHFGTGVKSLVNVLYHYGNVTSKTLEGVINSLGIKISAGKISDILKSEHDWAVEEQRAILRAGLSVNETVQMDCTGNLQKGENKTTHMLTGPLFSVFYTLGSKSRLACLTALQGNPDGGLTLMWHEHMEPLFREAKVSIADSKRVMEILISHKSKVLTIEEFDNLLKVHAESIYEKDRIRNLLKEVMAFCYYDNQQIFPRVKRLLTDDAPEYKKVAEFHGLCWIHDGRYYQKLSPALDSMKEIKDGFMEKYWAFYNRLLDYKELPTKQQKKQRSILEKAFDKLFQPTNKYGGLDQCIERTLANKDQLLLVLEFPFLPLHNNDSELAARKIVRKRDISLHTMTDWGTELRDAFLTIIETARKARVSVYKYIHDHISDANQEISLADRIRTQAIKLAVNSA